MERAKLRDYLIILVTGVTTLFSHLGEFFANIMESRNFITAREMVRHHNWLLPTMNLEPRLKKPPLPTWITAVFGKGFGFDSLAVLRIPVGITTLALAFFTYYFVGKATQNLRLALISALVLLTSFYVIYMGRTNNWDMYCHAFMIMALSFLYLALENQTLSYKNWIASGIFLGLSFLSKGPVAFYALWLPFLAAYGFTYRYKYLKKQGPGIVVMLLVAVILSSAWPLYVYYKAPVEAVSAATKESYRWLTYNTKPIWYYLDFSAQSGIWMFFSLTALLYPYMKKRVKNLKYYRFTFWWTLLSLLLLSLVPEKKTRYLLPVLIPLALTTANYVAYWFTHLKSTKDKWDKRLFSFNAGILLLICFGLPVAGIIMKAKGLNLSGFRYALISAVFLSCGFFILMGYRKRAAKTVFAAIVCMMVGTCLFATPIIGEFYKRDPTTRSFKALQRDASLRGVEFYTLDPSLRIELVWEAGKPIKTWDLDKPKPDKGKPILVFVPERGDKRMQSAIFKAYKVVYLGDYDYNHRPKGSHFYNPALRKAAFKIFPKK